MNIGTMIVIAVASTVVVLELIWVIITFNKLHRLRQSCLEAQSNLLALLETRYTAVTGVARITKAIIDHEADIQDKVAQLRTGMHINETAESLERTAKSLLATIEANPNLVTQEFSTNLMKTLRETEDLLLGSRLLYNKSIALYLDLHRMIPHRYLAAAFGFAQPEFFSAEIAHLHTTNKTHSSADQ